MLADRLGDEAGGDRRAVVMQDRHEPHRIDADLVDDQRAKLRVAVLFDHVDEIVVGDEACHAGMERKGAHAQPIELMRRRLQHADRLVHRRRGRAVIDHAVFGRLLRVGLERPRHQVLGGLELAQQPLHVVGVGRAFLGVARVTVARGAAGEERALGRMGARIGAVGNAVAVDVEIAAEVAAVVEHRRGHDLAAVILLVVVPMQRPAQPVIHADIEVEHQEDRGLQPVGEIEGLRGEIERLVRVLGKQQDVLGVAVRGIGAGDQVALLGAGRHAGRRPGALHVHDDGGDFGEVGQADKFLHQRNARPGGRGKGAGAVPDGADHDADRGEFVLALDDGVFRSSRLPDRGAAGLQWLVKASASEDDGVIGYQAQTVAPP